MSPHAPTQADSVVAGGGRDRWRWASRHGAVRAVAAGLSAPHASVAVGRDLRRRALRRGRAGGRARQRGRGGVDRGGHPARCRAPVGGLGRRPLRGGRERGPTEPGRDQCRRLDVGRRAGTWARARGRGLGRSAAGRCRGYLFDLAIGARARERRRCRVDRDRGPGRRRTQDRRGERARLGGRRLHNDAAQRRRRAVGHGRCRHRSRRAVGRQPLRGGRSRFTGRSRGHSDQS